QAWKRTNLLFRAERANPIFSPIFLIPILGGRRTGCSCVPTPGCDGALSHGTHRACLAGWNYPISKLRRRAGNRGPVVVDGMPPRRVGIRAWMAIRKIPWETASSFLLNGQTV